MDVHRRTPLMLVWVGGRFNIAFAEHVFDVCIIRLPGGIMRFKAASSG